MAFKQPPGKPSKVAFFISMLQQNEILAFTLRTVVSAASDPMSARANTRQYTINKSKPLLGYTGDKWEQHIVSQLDSALNKWVETVPDHRKALLSTPSSTLRY
jgi:hypothetical protein